MARSSYVLLLPLAAACGEDPPLPTQPQLPPQENVAVIHGLVTDGLLGSRLAGIRVNVGPVTLLSDSAGLFSGSVPKGKQTLLVDSYGYEKYQDTLTVITSHNLGIALVREAPAVTVCQADSSGIHAWIVDLQGRKSVDRRFATQVSIGGPGGTRHLTGNDLDWDWVDDFTWRVDIPGVLASRSDIHWRVVDGDGYHGIMSCDEASDQDPTDPGELL